MKSLKVQAIIDNYGKCMSFIELQLESANLDNQNTLKILSACEELIVNIITYAYPRGDGDIEIVFEDKDGSITITFIDSGKAFNPLQKPDADITTCLEEREIGGLGILMVKRLMDQIQYEYIDGQNRLIVVKRKAME